MKHISLGLFFLSIASQSFSMEKGIVNYKTDTNDYRFTISPTTIKNRLCSLYLNNFVNTTKIHESLGNRPISPEIVGLTVNTTIPLYLNTIHNNQNPYFCQNNSEFLKEHSNHITNNRIPMIKAILQDHPTAIDLLIKKGLLEEEGNNTTHIALEYLYPVHNHFKENNIDSTDSSIPEVLPEQTDEKNDSDDIYRLWDHLTEHFFHSGYFPVSKNSYGNNHDLETIFSFYRDYTNYDSDERIWQAFIDNKDQ